MHFTCPKGAETLGECTVLIYANGNNELEPEIARLLLTLESTEMPPKVTVLVQLGRAPYSLVSRIRPNIRPTNIDGDWSGVRRYKVLHSDRRANSVRTYSSKLLDTLNSTNMADPDTLSDFLQWGARNYPADKYIVVASGHGVGFIGLLSDYTTPYPQILPIPEFCSVLRDLKNTIGKPIDSLILDVCDMNYVEECYEHVADGTPVTDKLLLSGEETPLAGLPIAQIIAELVSNGQVTSEHVLTIRLSYAPLSRLKECKQKDDTLGELLKEVKSISEKVVVSEDSLYPLMIWIPTDLSQYERYRKWYDRLSINSGKGSEGGIRNMPFPLLLGSLSVYNPDLSESDLYTLASSLGWDDRFSLD